MSHHSKLRPGFTIIELVFIIVIIGILTAIAIGKLAVTRDDAKLSASVANMAICLTDASAHYAATQQDYNTTNHPQACAPENTRCFDITYAVNGKNFIVDTNTTHEGYCDDIENVGGHLAKEYDFAGLSIIR